MKNGERIDEGKGRMEGKEKRAEGREWREVEKAESGSESEGGETWVIHTQTRTVIGGIERKREGWLRNMC